jgi:hypothetical protein
LQNARQVRHDSGSALKDAQLLLWRIVFVKDLQMSEFCIKKDWPLHFSSSGRFPPRRLKRQNDGSFGHQRKIVMAAGKHATARTSRDVYNELTFTAKL